MRIQNLTTDPVYAQVFGRETQQLNVQGLGNAMQKTASDLFDMIARPLKEFVTLLNIYKPLSELKMINPGDEITIILSKIAPERTLYRYLYWSDFPVHQIKEGAEPNKISYLDLGKEITTNRKIKLFTKNQIAQKATSIVKNQSHGNEDARVEFGNINLGQINSIKMVAEEKTALNNRDQKTSQAITDLIAQKAKYVPRIGLSYSGGGLRAMYESLGFTIGLEQTQLLATISYAAALSGSTWFLMKWLKESGDKSLNEIRTDLQTSLIKGLLEQEILKPNTKDLRDVDPYRAAIQLATGKMYYPDADFQAQLKATLLCNNPFCTRLGKYRVIELWSYALARRIFAKHKQDKYTFTLSSLNLKAKNGQMPIPLFSAIRTNDDVAYARLMETRKNSTGNEKPRDYQLFEATPFAASFLLDQPNKNTQITRIPMWALGRKFEDNISMKQTSNFFNGGLNLQGSYFHPEPSAVQLAAAFGSIFAATFLEIGRTQNTVGTVLNIAQDAIGYAAYTGGIAGDLSREAIQKNIKLWLDTTNLARGLTMYDISYNTKGDPIEIRDGGIYYTLPLPLLFNPERNLDILIVNDSSGDLHEKLGNELDKFRKYEPRPDYITYKLSKDFLDEKLYQNKMIQLKNTLQNGKPPIAIFNDPRDPNFEIDKKTILYIPSISTNKSRSYGWQSPTQEYDTFKLQYSGKEASMLIDYGIDLAKQVAQEIKAVIKARAEKEQK